MKRIVLTLMLTLMVGAVVNAQPSKRKTSTAAAAKKSDSGNAASDRAALSFPTSEAMPEDVSWRRDIYRELDLVNNNKNSALYYPTMPVGKQCCLFTFLFKLVVSGRIQAYKYTLDGNETFTDKNKLSIKEMLDNYEINYKEKDGKYTVLDVDVPNEQVTKYLIKESNYLDQYTNDTRAKVTAICPILMKEGDFDGVTPYPLFWLKYDDISTYLAKLPVMTSDLNNVTNMNADDYFSLNLYDGTIYKTNNMRGLQIQDYCKTDSAKVQEQKRIEKQLTDFDDHLWGHDLAKKDSTDSINAAKDAKASKKAKKDEEASEEDKDEKVAPAPSRAGSRRQGTTSTSKTKATTKKTKSEKTKSTKSSGSKATVSVRRTRR